jgi:ABC-type dipeptide/oligopeptide/nickel transport system permease subunit
MTAQLTDLVANPVGGEPAIDGAVVVTGSPARLALRRFASNRLAMIGAAVLAVLVIGSFIVPLVVPIHPNQIDLARFRQAPSWAHWLGTDDGGRDILARLLVGGRVSITVGVLSAATAVAIGLILGVLAGTGRRSIDSTIMRITDVTLSFPSLLVVLVISGILGPSVVTLIVAIGAFEWPTTCRLVRGLMLSLREQEFVLAARALGVSERRLVLRHIVPAVLLPLTVVATLLVAQAVLLEAALSFLGLGVQPPQASWGNMLTAAQSLTVLQSMPWMWLPPGLAIILTVLSVNFVGDGLRDAVDTRR